MKQELLFFKDKFKNGEGIAEGISGKQIFEKKIFFDYFFFGKEKVRKIENNNALKEAEFHFEFPFFGLIRKLMKFCFL